MNDQKTYDEPPEVNAVNILIVDDVEANAQAFVDVLEPIGETIIIATSGREALRSVLRNDLAVIILDVEMPDMNGFEVATIVRNNKSKRHIPIIFATAHSDGEHEIFKGYELGAVDYLIKPVKPHVLLSKVQIFVDLYRMSIQISRQQEQLLKERKILERSHLNEIAELQKAIMRIGQTDSPHRAVTNPEHQLHNTTIKQRTPETLKFLAEIYTSILEEYVDAVGVQGETPKKKIKDFVRNLSSYDATAKDVIDIHITSVTNQIPDTSNRRINAMAIEGRLLTIEVMGELVNIYRESIHQLRQQIHK